MSSQASEPLVARNRLVDHRLDLLDRILLGYVERAERVEIVRSVETQIDRMLAGLGEPAPSDEQVLAVLARLDPPEALIPKIAAAQTVSTGGTAGWLSEAWGGTSPFRRPILKAARLACGMAAFSFVLLLAAPYFYVLASVGMMASAGMQEYAAVAIIGVFLVLLLGSSLAAAGTALYALWQLCRRRGTHTGYVWATAALIAATIPLLLGGLGAVYLGSQIMELL